MVKTPDTQRKEVYKLINIKGLDLIAAGSEGIVVFARKNTKTWR